MSTTGAVIMVGAGGHTPAEHLVQAARQAAACDLIAQLQRTGLETIIVAAPAFDWLGDRPPLCHDPDDPAVPFHFGQRLAGIIERYRLEQVLYFGGGSAPLLDDATLTTITRHLAEAGRTGRDTPLVLTNNKHSSDWLALTHAPAALDTLRAADRDNSLAWLLDQGGAFTVRVLTGTRPATALDLDTPADLALLAHHPDTKPILATWLASAPCLDALPVTAITQRAAQVGSHLTLIGRVSPLAWLALNQATQAWIRVFSEERGMVASGRLERGEVRSLLGEMLARQGPRAFFDTLASMTDAAIIDSRPLIASQGYWPGDADRFASDLFLVDQIANDWLREFTKAAQAAPIPVLLGGHSVVAGGLHALIDITEKKKAAW